MAEEVMAVYCNDETVVLEKHMTFTCPSLNQTFGQNYLNSLYYIYIYIYIKASKMRFQNLCIICIKNILKLFITLQPKLGLLKTIHK